VTHGCFYAGIFAKVFEIVSARLRLVVVVLSLAEEVRHKVGAQGELLGRSQNTEVHKLGNAVPLEVLEELLSLQSGHKSLLGFFTDHAIGAHLQVAAFQFVLLAHGNGFDALSFEQLAFSELSKFLVVFLERLNFVLLFHFDESLFESTAAQDL
jgi:hypothetical protein